MSRWLAVAAAVAAAGTRAVAQAQSLVGCGNALPVISLIGPTEVTIDRGRSYVESSPPGYNVTDDLSGVNPGWTIETGWVGPCSPGTFASGTFPDDTTTRCANASNCTCDQGNYVYLSENRPGVRSPGGAVFFKRYTVTDAPNGNTASVVRRVTTTERLSTGAAGCKCINESIYDTSLPIRNVFEFRSNIPCLVVANASTGDQYCYKPDYGMEGCRAWEEEIIPVCVDGYFREVPGRPSWCASPWCYVDPLSCDVALHATPSAFFDGMYYSYTTCGQQATYDEVGHRYIRSQSDRTVIATETYVISGLAVAFALLVCFVAFRHVRAAQLRQRPADFRKIIEALNKSEEAALHAAKSPKKHTGLEFTKGAKKLTAHREKTEQNRQLLTAGDAKPSSAGSASQDESPDLKSPREAKLRDSDDDINVPLELKRSQISLEEVLGSGQFGQVCRGRLTTQVGRVKHVVDVAVKTVQDTSAAGNAAAAVQTDFLNEAVITWQFEDDNVVQMYGVVTSGFPYYLVLELCQNGELLAYVKEHRDLEVSTLVEILRGIASGMAYLSARDFVHRDLAARNVLLDDNLKPRICDFGLGRGCEGDYYRMKTDMLLPIRWTDPWAFENQVFSEATDVWSFGVLGLEVFSHGARPYGGWPNYLVLSSLKEGYRHPRPSLMPPAIYQDVVFPCWTYGPDNSTDLPPNKKPADKGEKKPVGGVTHAPPECLASRITFAELKARLALWCARDRERQIIRIQSDAFGSETEGEGNDVDGNGDVTAEECDAAVSAVTRPLVGPIDGTPNGATSGGNETDGSVLVGTISPLYVTSAVGGSHPSPVLPLYDRTSLHPQPSPLYERRSVATEGLTPNPDVAMYVSPLSTPGPAAAANGAANGYVEREDMFSGGGPAVGSRLCPRADSGWADRPNKPSPPASMGGSSPYALVEVVTSGDLSTDPLYSACRVYRSDSDTDYLANTATAAGTGGLETTDTLEEGTGNGRAVRSTSNEDSGLTSGWTTADCPSREQLLSVSEMEGGEVELGVTAVEIDLAVPNLTGLRHSSVRSSSSV